jgi:hypothetical protein
MKIAAKYSHLNGYEWFLVHQRKLWREIEATIASVDARILLTKGSNEKNPMRPRLLNAPTELNKEFARRFMQAGGWTEGRKSNLISNNSNRIRETLNLADLPANEQKQEIIDAGKKPIFSYNQTDFVKNRVAVEIQFGKYSFIAYDLFVKHLAFFVGNAIDVGVEILPMKEMQTLMSSGPGYYEGALYDLARQGRGVPAVPLVLIGVTA